MNEFEKNLVSCVIALRYWSLGECKRNVKRIDVAPLNLLELFSKGPGLMVPMYIQ
jgi:hypothetical protein